MLALQLTNLALYAAAQWAIPKLQQVQEEDRSPSFIVTSTNKLWKEPVYDLMSLSMVKSAQRALGKFEGFKACTMSETLANLVPFGFCSTQLA